MKFSEWFTDFGFFVKTGFNAFPWTVTSGFLLSVLSIIAIHQDVSGLTEIIIAAICAGLGIPLFFAIEASGKIAWSSKTKYIGLGLVLLFLGFVYYILPVKDWPDATIQKVIGLFICAHLLVSFAPFIGGSEDETFWKYNLTLFQNILASILFGFVLIIGISLSIKSVEFLFNVNIGNKFYGYTIASIMGVFTTLFFSWRFNKNEIYTSSENLKNKISSISFFVLLPLLGLYLFVLYGYMIKVTASGSLPRGWVTHLVFFYSVLSIFIYLISYNNTGKLRATHKFLIWLMIAPVIFLFIAIRWRLGDYGVTHMRYFVASLACWLALIIVLYTLGSRKVSLKFIPMTLFATVLLVLFLPRFNAYSIAKKSQKNRIVSHLISTGYPNFSESPERDEKLLFNQIHSAILYLGKHDGEKELSDIADYFNLENAKEKWSSNDLIKLLRIRTHTDVKVTDRRNDGIQYYHTDLTDYQIQLDSQTYIIKPSHRKREFTIGEDAFVFKIVNNGKLDIQINDETYEVDWDVLVNNLIYSEALDRKGELQSPSSMRHNLLSKEWEMSIVFNQIVYNIENKSVDEAHIEYVYLKRR